MMVDRAFDRLDTDGDGTLDYQEVLAGYNAKQDPRVINGDATAEQAKIDFLGAFEFSKAGSEIKGCVTRKEWREFFNNISASVDSDRMFEMTLNNAWSVHQYISRTVAAAPIKLLITHLNGKESVESISDEFGFRESDVDFNTAIVVYLKKHRGIVCTHLEVLNADGSRRHPEKINGVHRRPILGYKGHQHQKRERMGTTFQGWQSQRDQRDR